MELKWVHYEREAPNCVLVNNDIATGYRLYCDKHWDTGAPDEWVIRKGGYEVSFPTRAEAQQYAEATYTLQEASHGKADT